MADQNSKNIFIIAGEASGDNLGAGLMREAKVQDSSINFTGIGGPQMIAQGLDTLLPIEEISVMGIWEVIWQLPRLLRIIEGIVSEIEKRQPDVVITIDAQDLSLQVAGRLRKNGIYKGKLVHYVAPTVWAWRPGRAKKIAELYDLLMCLFPFEPQYFEPHGIKTEFVGHPLIEYADLDADNHAFRQKSDLAPETPVLGLFLGSREREIKRMIGPFAQTVSVLQEQIPDLRIIVPTTKSREYDVIEALRAHNLDGQVITSGDIKWSAFKACNIALAVSGTVGLELAYMGIPHVIGYKTDMPTFLIIRLLVKVKFAHLANILLDKMAVPEFLQSKCSPDKIAPALLRLYKDQQSRNSQIQDLTALRESLSRDTQTSPSANATAAVLNLLNA